MLLLLFFVAAAVAASTATTVAASASGTTVSVAAGPLHLLERSRGELFSPQHSEITRIPCSSITGQALLIFSFTEVYVSSDSPYLRHVLGGHTLYCSSMCVLR